MTRLDPNAAETKQSYGRWRARVFFTCWTMYATYYLCRANLSLAIPALKELDWLTDWEVALIPTALTLSYGVGQLLNGVLGDRFGPRKVGAIGMVISAAANVVFGLAMSFPVMLGAWIVNGLAQATGAPSRIKAFSNWFSPRVRGRMMGLLGTDYVFGNAMSWLLSGWLVAAYGWRYVFIVPAGILLLSAIHVAIRLRNTPESVGLPTLEAMERAEAGVPMQSDADDAAQGEDEDDESEWTHVLSLAVKNPKVWIVGVAYFGVDLFRYGFLIWSYDFLVSLQASGAEGAAGGVEGSSLKAVLKVVMMPLIGAVGIVLSGWFTDRMGGRRAPTIAVMLLISAALAWAFYRSVIDTPESTVLHMVLLGAIGFFLYGPHLLMGATIAMDLGSRKAAGTASGIIDWLGYMGAALAGVGTKWAQDLTGDYSGPFVLWIAGVIVAAVLMLFLWNTKPRKDTKYV